MRIKLEEFICKYFHLPPLLSFGTKCSRMHQNFSPLLNTLSHLPVPEILEYYGEEMILQRVLVARRQNFKVKHSPGITLGKFV